MESNNTTERPHVTELVSGMRGFGLIDYGIFIAMLAVSAVIGIYFGYKEKKENQSINRRRDSIELEYLVGGRKLKIFPVALSLTASWVSGISIMGMSSEVYVFGTQFTLYLISVVIGSTVVHYIFIPVFHDLKITSSYEYLEMRYSKKLRLLSATVFVIALIIWLPLVFFATALAFNQLTGISIHIITPVTCSICIFYTCLGGMKAVVWTDAIQTIMMFGTIISIVIRGTMNLGLDTIWEQNYASGRIELPEMTLDPIVRHSLFSVLIGGMFTWTSGVSTNQMFIQRYVSLPTVKAARRSLWLFVFSVVSLLGMCFYCGMLAYAKYHNCDPMLTKLAKSKDQILPVLVSDLFKNVPGFPGLFVSGIFSAALSSLSTALNSLSAVILEDFFKQLMDVRPSKRMTNFIMRSTVVVAGFMCVGLVFVVEKLGSILQLSMSISGSTSGPMFALFVMGVLMPRINTKAAFIGSGCGVIFMVYIVIRAQLDMLAGKITFTQKPIAADNCPYDFGTLSDGLTNATVLIPEDEMPYQIHRISYLFYNLLGLMVTIVISTIASFFLKHDVNNVRPDLLAPFIRKTYEYKKPTKQQVEFVHRFDNIKPTDYNK